MKKHIIWISLVLLLSSCTSTSTEGVPTSDQTIISSDPSVVTSDQTVVSTEPYSFSEVNPLFGPGPFSVNELVEIFGEPTLLSGHYNGENNFFVVSAVFEDVMFDLAANNGENLNFMKNDTSPSTSNRYEVTDSDREVRMKPQIISVSGGNWELPRKIKLGDSRETLYEAYDGNKGKEQTAQGQFLVSYDYGESGRIIYHFYTDAIDKLVQVTIEWYDSHDREDVSGPLGVPSA